MSGPEDKLSLYQGTILSGLTYAEIWEQQAIFGGSAGPIEVEAYVLGLLRPDAYQHDMIAQAINERFLELGGDHPVGYSDNILN